RGDLAVEPLARLEAAHLRALGHELGLGLLGTGALGGKRLTRCGALLLVLVLRVDLLRVGVDRLGAGLVLVELALLVALVGLVRGRLGRRERLADLVLARGELR